MLVGGVPVWRSTVVRGAKSAQVLASSFGATRAGSSALCVHSQRALVSNDMHWTQLWSATPHFEQRASSSTVSPRRLPHRAQRTLRARPSGSASWDRPDPAADVLARAPSVDAAPAALSARAALIRPGIRAGGTFCRRSCCSGRGRPVVAESQRDICALRFLRVLRCTFVRRTLARLKPSPYIGLIAMASASVP